MFLAQWYSTSRQGARQRGMCTGMWTGHSQPGTFLSASCRSDTFVAKLHVRNQGWLGGEGGGVGVEAGDGGL